jgi:hypothetical protein
MARHASKQIHVRLFSAALAAAAALGLADGSRAAIFSATSGGLSAIQVDTGESFVVDFRVDTEGEFTPLYFFAVHWDGGSAVTLAVENPTLPPWDEDVVVGDIEPVDPDGEEGLILALNLLNTYTASTPGSEGTIGLFFAANLGGFTEPPDPSVLDHVSPGSPSRRSARGAPRCASGAPTKPESWE